jgi:hypothetical protein
MNRAYHLRKLRSAVGRQFAVWLLVFALIVSVIYINPAEGHSAYAAEPEPLTPVGNYDVSTPIILQYTGTDSQVVIPVGGRDGDYDIDSNSPYYWYIDVDGNETNAGIFGPRSAYSGTGSLGGAITITVPPLGSGTHEVVIRPADTVPAVGWGKALGVGSWSANPSVHITAVTQDPDIAYLQSAITTGDYFRYYQYFGCDTLTTTAPESLPTGVTAIGDGFRCSQYAGCISLTTAAAESLPAGVATIGNDFRSYQYSDCKSLATAVAESLPAGVTTIGAYFRLSQYQNCTSLTTAAAESIPAGITTI